LIEAPVGQKKKKKPKPHTFEQNTTLLIIKTCGKQATEENFLNLLKGIYKDPVVTITLNGEKSKASKIRKKARQF
jgi:hypothetical protein